MCNCQLRWQWWAQVESNHRPHAYQACALTFWAMSPCYLHNHRKSPRFFNRWSGVLSFEPRFGFSTDGGDEGIRTLDPLLAGQVLSQLSYTPILREEVIVKSEEVFFIFHHSLFILFSQLSLKIEQQHLRISFFVVCFVSLRVTSDLVSIPLVLHRKEVIQPHLPIRLPCYDLTPITEPTFGSCPLAVSSLTSGVSDFHGLTGGVYKARERIHRGMLIRDY